KLEPEARTAIDPGFNEKFYREGLALLVATITAAVMPPTTATAVMIPAVVPKNEPTPPAAAVPPAAAPAAVAVTVTPVAAIAPADNVIAEVVPMIAPCAFTTSTMYWPGFRPVKENAPCAFVVVVPT